MGMPIRAEAAKELANQLFGTLLEQNMVPSTIVELAASIIINAVKIDECKQTIESLEAA